MNEQELQDLQKMLEIAVNALEDVKAKDIAVLETQEKTPLFARMIIASGDSTRQVRALVNNVAVDLKAAGFEILSTEGQEGGEWALVDAGADLPPGTILHSVHRLPLPAALDAGSQAVAVGLYSLVDDQLIPGSAVILPQPAAGP